MPTEPSLIPSEWSPKSAVFKEMGMIAHGAYLRNQNLDRNETDLLWRENFLKLVILA